MDTCGKCRYFVSSFTPRVRKETLESFPDYRFYGECHRNPPSVVIVHGLEHNPVFVRPKVFEDDVACLDFANPLSSGKEEKIIFCQTVRLMG